MAALGKQREKKERARNNPGWPGRGGGGGGAIDENHLPRDCQAIENTRHALSLKLLHNAQHTMPLHLMLKISFRTKSQNEKRGLFGFGAGLHGHGLAGATAYPFRRLVLGSDALQVVHVIRWLQAHRLLTTAILMSPGKGLPMRFVWASAFCRCAISACIRKLPGIKQTFSRLCPFLTL